MLSLTNISVSCGTTPVLTNISLTLSPGTISALTGPNGAGKSSLARVIMGHHEYTITGGEIYWEKENITQKKIHERAQLGIFVSFQHPVTIPGLSIRMLLHELARIHTPNNTINIDTILDTVGLPRHYADRSVNDGFSGGEKKRVELAQLLVINPRVIILDEIDSGMDQMGIETITVVLDSLMKRNPHCAILIISHYQKLLELCHPQRIYKLTAGSF